MGCPQSSRHCSLHVPFGPPERDKGGRWGARKARDTATLAGRRHCASSLAHSQTTALHPCAPSTSAPARCIPTTAAHHWEATEVWPTHEGTLPDTVAEHSPLSLSMPIPSLPWTVPTTRAARRNHMGRPCRARTTPQGQLVRMTNPLVSHGNGHRPRSRPKRRATATHLRGAQSIP